MAVAACLLSFRPVRSQKPIAQPSLAGISQNSGVKKPRLPAPMTVTRQLVSRKLRCPAIAGVQAAQPLLAHELARGLEEVWIVRRRVVRHIRQDRRLRATGHVRPGRVVVLAEFDE